MTQPTLIDLKRIRDIFGEDKFIINEFFNTFLSTAAELLQRIDEAFKAKESQHALDLLHRLKGSAANGGANELHLLTLAAEAAVLQSDWRRAEKIRQVMKPAFDRLVAEVEEQFTIKILHI